MDKNYRSDRELEMSIESDMQEIKTTVVDIADKVENMHTMFAEGGVENPDLTALKAEVQGYASNADNINKGTVPVVNGGTGVNAIADIQAGKDASGNVITDTYATKVALKDVSDTLVLASPTQNGFMSKEDKAKLNGVEANANNYTLPMASSTLGGVKTTSTVADTSEYTACPIVSGIPYYKDTNTTYNKASSSTDGLMSKEDKTKLDSVEANAQVNTVTGIKGNAESTYRTGDVNITYANIGAAASNHNHNASDINAGTLSADRIPGLDASKITSGTIDIARLPATALERLVTVTDETARKVLTKSNIQIGDTVKETSTGKMYRVVDDTKLNSDSGYVEYTVGTAGAVDWSGVTNKPSSYTPASHKHGNITNDGKIGTTASLPIITGSDGVLQAGSFGTAAGTFCQGNDSRLTNARNTPNSLTLKVKSGTTEGTDLYTFNGSTAKTLDIKQGSNITLTAASGALTIAAKDTTYSAATSSAAGLMSAADKSKLDGIAAQANNYSLPTAGKDALGGVKTNSTVTSTSGLTACPIIDGIPYYKDTNTTYSLSSLGIGNVKNYDQSKAIKAITRNGTTFTYTCLDGTTGTFTQQDSNTTYSNFVKSGSGAAAGLVPSPGTTAGTTKYLREDGTWQVPPNTTYTVTTSGSGNAVTAVSLSNGTITATKGTTFLTSHQSLSNYSTLANTVKSISISGKIITVTPGSGNAYTLTTQDTNTTYSNFVKSGSGAKAGLVPAPSTTAGTTKYLREDGTWQVPPDTNTTYSNFVKSGSGAKAGLVPAPSTTAGTTKYLREDGTWSVPPDNNTVYTHPTSSGNKHIPSGGSSGQFLGWSADGTAKWVNNPNTNTTYTFATGDSNGQIKVTPSGGSASNISVKGLGSAAYTASTAYAAASHTHSYLPLSGGTLTGSWKVKVSTINVEDVFTDGTTENWFFGVNDVNDKNFATFGVSRTYKNGGNRLAFRIKDADNHWGDLKLEMSHARKFHIIPAVGSNVTWEGWGGTLPVQNTLYPYTDNSINLGDSTHRWKVAYAGTATINTSDQRLKQNIQNLPDKVLDAWSEVNFIEFKFKDAVKEKGEDTARKHCGLIAQSIQTIFTKYDLDAREYGLFCYDEYEAYDIEHRIVDKEAAYDNEGNEIESEQVHYETEHKEAGNIYSLRYEEALCMEAAYQRRRADRLEARLTTVEERLAALEAKLAS